MEDDLIGNKVIGGILQGLNKVLHTEVSVLTKTLTSPIVKSMKKFWENDAVNSMKQFISKSWGRIKGHIDEVLGPVKEAFDFIWDTLKSITSFFQNIGKSVLQVFGFGGKDKELDETKKQTGLLKRIYNFFIHKDIRDTKAIARSAIGKGERKPLWYLIVGAALLALGLAIGGLVRKILLPIELFGKGMAVLGRIGSSLGRLGALFLKIPGMSSLVEAFSKGIKFVSKTGRIFAYIGKHVPLLGKLFSGIKIGFQKLAWPITIVFALIDFIKGFSATQGDIFEKIKGGLSAAVRGFIEMPIKLLGWITDWVLGKFGLETEIGSKAAQYIIDGIVKTVGIAIDVLMTPFRIILWGAKSIISLFKGEKTFTDIFGEIISKGEEIIAAIKDFFTGPFGKILDFIKNIGKRIKEVASKFFGGGEPEDRYNMLEEKRKVGGLPSLSQSEKDEWFKLQTERRKTQDLGKQSKADEITTMESKKADILKKKEDDRLISEKKSDDMFTGMDEWLHKESEKTSKILAVNNIVANKINQNQSTDEIPDQTDNYMLSFSAFALLK